MHFAPAAQVEEVLCTRRRNPSAAGKLIESAAIRPKASFWVVRPKQRNSDCEPTTESVGGRNGRVCKRQVWQFLFHH